MAFVLGAEGNGKTYFLKYNLKTFENQKKDSCLVVEIDFKEYRSLNFDSFLDIL